MDPRRVPEIIDGRTYGQRGYPHELWEKLRTHSPLQWFEGVGIKPFWAVTRHRDIVEIGLSPETYINAPRIMADMEVRPNLVRSRHLLNMDGAEHDAYRAVLGPRFSLKALRPGAPRVQEIVQGALHRVLAGPRRWEGDFVADVARSIPPALVADLLGLTPADHAQLISWSEDLVAPADPDHQRGRSTEETYVQAERALFHWFAPRIAERRQRPGDDLISHLARTPVMGKPPSDEMVLSFCQLFVTAGIDTTLAALCRSMQALSAHPDQYSWLRQHPGEVPLAVEELLRFGSPVIHFCRTPIRDIELRGVTVRRGQTLALFYPSANRDAEVFEEPDRLRLERPRNHHVAFGSGAHYCLGAPLARMVLQAFLGLLTQKVKSIESRGAARYVASSVIGGIKHLPLALELG